MFVVNDDVIKFIKREISNYMFDFVNFIKKYEVDFKEIFIRGFLSAGDFKEFIKKNKITTINFDEVVYDEFKNEIVKRRTYDTINDTYNLFTLKELDEYMSRIFCNNKYYLYLDLFSYIFKKNITSVKTIKAYANELLRTKIYNDKSNGSLYISFGFYSLLENVIDRNIFLSVPVISVSPTVRFFNSEMKTKTETFNFVNYMNPISYDNSDNIHKDFLFDNYGPSLFFDNTAKLHIKEFTIKIDIETLFLSMSMFDLNTIQTEKLDEFNEFINSITLSAIITLLADIELASAFVDPKYILTDIFSGFNSTLKKFGTAIYRKSLYNNSLRSKLNKFTIILDYMALLKDLSSNYLSYSENTPFVATLLNQSRILMEEVISLMLTLFNTRTTTIMGGEKTVNVIQLAINRLKKITESSRYEILETINRDDIDIKTILLLNLIYENSLYNNYLKSFNLSIKVLTGLLEQLIVLIYIMTTNSNYKYSDDKFNEIKYQIDKISENIKMLLETLHGTDVDYSQHMLLSLSDNSKVFTNTFMPFNYEKNKNMFNYFINSSQNFEVAVPYLINKKVQNIINELHMYFSDDNTREKILYNDRYKQLYNDIDFIKKIKIERDRNQPYVYNIFSFNMKTYENTLLTDVPENDFVKEELKSNVFQYSDVVNSVKNEFKKGEGELGYNFTSIVEDLADPIKITNGIEAYVEEFENSEYADDEEYKEYIDSLKKEINEFDSIIDTVGEYFNKDE